MSEKLEIKEILAKIAEAIENGANKEAFQEMIDDCGVDEGDVLSDLIKALNYDMGGIEGISDFASNIELVEEFNRDDYGAEAYIALKYKPTGQLFGAEGWYSSEEGFDADADGWTDFEPYQVTQYRKAK